MIYVVALVMSHNSDPLMKIYFRIQSTNWPIKKKSVLARFEDPEVNLQGDLYIYDITRINIIEKVV